MKLDTNWKKWLYRLSMIFLAIGSFPLGTIVVGLNWFVVNPGKDNWKKTDMELNGIVEKIIYILGWLMIISIIASGIILLVL